MRFRSLRPKGLPDSGSAKIRDSGKDNKLGNDGDLGALFRATMQPTASGEPWIDAEEVIKRVSKRRKRRCSVEEVTAALRGDSIPAMDLVSVAIEIREERLYDKASAKTNLRHKIEDEERVSRLLAMQRLPGNSEPRRRLQLISKIAAKKTSWAIGVVAAAILTVLATVVVPDIARQLFNGSALEDKLRSGPALVANESLVYLNGPDVPVPTVMPEDYVLSGAVKRAVSQPLGSAAPVFLKQEHAEGVIVGQMFVRLVLEGNRNQIIRIVGIQPVELRKKMPIGGSLFVLGGQATEDNVKIDFDLDQASPQAREVTGYDVVTDKLFFLDHTISLKKGEQEVLLIQIDAACYDAKFDLAIDYTIGGAQHAQTISNSGHPFELTGVRGNVLSYRHVYSMSRTYSIIELSAAEIKSQFHSTPAEASCPSQL